MALEEIHYSRPHVKLQPIKLIPCADCLARLLSIESSNTADNSTYHKVQMTHQSCRHNHSLYHTLACPTHNCHLSTQTAAFDITLIY